MVERCVGKLPGRFVLWLYASHIKWGLSTYVKFFHTLKLEPLKRFCHLFNYQKES